MKFKLNIEIDMDNDAFVEDPNAELDEILRPFIANHMFITGTKVYEDNARLADSNGNTVGSAIMEVIDA